MKMVNQDYGYLVMDGDRQLSYGELAELDAEFDGAYMELRRPVKISGPEEFDCPERFRK